MGGSTSTPPTCVYYAGDASLFLSRCVLIDFEHIFRGVVIDTLGYSWIPFFLDTWQIFGIQVSKYPKKTCFYAKLPDTWDS